MAWEMSLCGSEPFSGTLALILNELFSPPGAGQKGVYQ
jgi:hypothetical protein